MTDNALIPPPLRRAFGGALQSALNRVLALDPESREALQGLDGRRIGLRLIEPPIALSLRVDGDQLRVEPPDDTERDLDISASIGAVISRLLPRNEAKPLPGGKLRINGDAELAQQMQRLAKKFDPDWQKPFVDVFGDVLGFQIAKRLREAFLWGREQAGHAARDTADFLTTESRELVHPIELDDFNGEVDQLRAACDRIEARIKRLTASLPATTASARDA